MHSGSAFSSAALLAALLVPGAVPTASAAAADNANGMAEAGLATTLPTGDDARPRSPLVPDLADLSGGPERFSEGLDRYRTVSLAPGPLPLSSRFGWRSDPLGRGARFHFGVDIPARSGAAVRAVSAGRVVFSGWAGGYGNLVVIDHGGGVRSRYGHLERALVAAGDPVGKGAAIGAVGSTGRATGPHLHYEVRVGGMAVDPLHAAMRGPAELAWPESEVPSEVASADIAPHWSWRAADQADMLPEPFIR
jgi:murein DD-endopeptidase MepM/ murein hydrolase activator NlpD